ncbi:amidase [Hyaloraphidium curvatum]|nr:amidase [Hyaloraphidium curvatum]
MPDSGAPAPLLGAFETARAIAEGRTTAAAEVEAAIARIEAVNPAVNAVIIKDYDAAREQAKQADEQVKQGVRKPLLGVPMTVKESFRTKGHVCSWGNPDFKDNVATEDAEAVQLLREAGAIILGKTNVPLNCADIQSFNVIYGKTVNPYDKTRTCGGSSGGSGVSLATGMVPLELGSDIGGSIRTPAAFNGVFGHKPTIDVVPLDGMPKAETEPLHPAVAGPLARSADDLAGALDLLSRVPLPKSRFSSLKGVRLLVMTEHPVKAAVVMKDIAAAIENAAKRAEAAGAVVTRDNSKLPDLVAFHDAYTTTLAVTMSHGMVNAEGKTPSVPEWLALLGKQNAARLAWGRFFRDFDAILAPVHGSVAFKHDEEPDLTKRMIDIDGEQHPFWWQFAWAGIPVYGCLPATSVPIGLSKEGLPINMQVIASEMRDHDAIAIGGMLAIPNPIVVPK